MDNTLILEKEEENRRYIHKHISNVKLAWDNMKKNKKCMDIIKSNMKYESETYILSIVEYMLSVHDQSKFSPEEFYAYRKMFYPIDDKEKEEVQKSGEWDKAVQHHYDENIHHWNHWVNNKDDMPFLAVLEMVLDWTAMGYQFGDTALDYYNKNKDKMELGERQRSLTEELLEAFCK